MADIKSPDMRSLNMSHIRGSDTKPEEYIRKKLFAKGIRYRKNYSGLIGKPDVWLSKYKTAVFVNGCFWHRHEGCKYSYSPKSRQDFWQEKFQKNITRDERVRDELSQRGIKILIIWECTVNRMKKNAEEEAAVLERIGRYLVSDEMFLEI